MSCELLEHGVGFVFGLLAGEPGGQLGEAFFVSDLWLVAEKGASFGNVGVAVADVAGAVFAGDNWLQTLRAQSRCE